MAQSLMQIIIEAVDKASGTFKNVANNATKMQGETQKAGSTTVSTFDKATESILDYAAGFLTVAAATKAARMAWDAAKLGARMESTTLAATNMATGMGASLDDIVSSIQRASLGTVSEFDAIQSASNAMMLGLGADSQKLGNLMEIAALRGRAMGLSTTQAFSDMVRGIGRLSPMILDNLGIVVDAEATFSAYAESVGKTANELTSAEKRQALLNRVLQEGNALLEQTGGLAMDVATAYDRVGAKWTDFTNSFKQNLAYDFLPFITDKTTAIRLNQERMNEALATGDFKKYTAAMQDIAMLQRVFYQAPVSQSQFAALSKAFQPFIDSVVTTGRVVETQKEARTAFIGTNQELALQAGLTGDLTSIYQDFDEAMKKAGKSSEKQAAAIKKLSESTGEFLYSLASGALKGDAQGQISLAFALGQIDTASMNAAIAVDALGQAYNAGKISLSQYLQGVKGMKAGLDSLPPGKTITIDVLFKMGGISVPGMYFMSNIGKWVDLGQGGYTEYYEGMAAGGSVSAGTPYIVGERGPEMFVPNQSGQIIPNNQLGAGRTQVLNFTYAPTISTASQSEIEWILKPAIKKVMREYA